MENKPMSGSDETLHSYIYSSTLIKPALYGFALRQSTKHKRAGLPLRLASISSIRRYIVAGGIQPARPQRGGSYLASAMRSMLQSNPHQAYSSTSQAIGDTASFDSLQASAHCAVHPLC